MGLCCIALWVSRLSVASAGSWLLWPVLRCCHSPLHHINYGIKTLILCLWSTRLVLKLDFGAHTKKWMLYNCVKTNFLSFSFFPSGLVLTIPSPFICIEHIDNTFGVFGQRTETNQERKWHLWLWGRTSCTALRTSLEMPLISPYTKMIPLHLPKWIFPILHVVL